MLRAKKELIEHEPSDFREIRLEASLDRVLQLKSVLEKSGWFYALSKRMITEEIHKKPLAQFMAGKFPIRLSFLCLCRSNKKRD